jgi:hypothetical protein
MFIINILLPKNRKQKNKRGKKGRKRKTSPILFSEK